MSGGAATGAERLVEGLVLAGADVVFGLPGVHNLAAWDALSASGIELVCVRHEQAAVYAADGYSRATGRLGVALLTTGPGAANALGASGEAWASRSPLLVIATDIPAALRRPGVHRGVLHECVDQPGMFGPVVKGALAAGRAGDVGPAAVRGAALALASPRRPVYLQVPTDLLDADSPPPGGPPAPAPREAPDEAAAGLAAELLAAARTPLVWAGGGAVAAGAGPALAMLAERLAAPVVTTFSGRGLLAPDHPLDVGLPPHVPECGALWDEADVVLAVGSDLDGMSTQNWAMPRPERLVAVNVDRDEASKAWPPDAVVCADARAGVADLLARLGPPDDAGERAARVAARLAGARSAARERLAREHPAEVAFLDAFAAAVPAQATVVADMCIPGYWLSAFRRPDAPRRMLYPMGWGTLGFAFPAALGAACALRGGAIPGPVVSVSGDGGFLFAAGELATLAQERLPLTAVIVDDGGYGMLRYDQGRRAASTASMDLATPDFAALARSFGVRAEAVEGLGEAFGAALAAHVADPEPSVLVARCSLDPPPTTSPRWYRLGRE